MGYSEIVEKQRVRKTCALPTLRDATLRVAPQGEVKRKLEPMSVTVQAGPTRDALTIDRLKAYYINEHYGVSREVRAVDDVSLVVRRNEIYGLAGESSSGKTS